VLAAALRVMTAKGPSDFTLADIAAAAGIAPATLVQRFGDKRRLVVAAFAQDNDAFAGALADLPPGRGAEAVIAVFRLLTPGVEDVGVFADQLLWLRQDMRDPDLNRLAATASAAARRGGRAPAAAADGPRPGGAAGRGPMAGRAQSVGHRARGPSGGLRHRAAGGVVQPACLILRPACVTRRVADRLDIAAFGIQHEGAVIVGMIVGPDPGRAVVPPAAAIAAW